MHRQAPYGRHARYAAAWLAAFLMVVPLAVVMQTAAPASAIDNEISAENALPGSPASEWDVSGAGDESIQGYATQISVNRSETVEFKIDTDAADYGIDIYRLGWYQGNGARKVATIDTAATIETQQPECALIDGTTDDNLVDCGNWSVSASWSVPGDAVSGVYIARPTRADTGGASHIVFIVRDDDGSSDLLFQTSDTTWQSYNPYGGYNAYDTGPEGVNAQKLSYNRPFATRGAERENWLFNSEYPMIRWLERNGYDVSYTTHLDTGTRPEELLEHEAFLSVGHDEYWSQEQRDAVEAARDAGVDLAFFSGNEVYWKIRLEDSTQDPAPDQRTQVIYKEGSAAPLAPDEHRRCYADYSCDPSETWTGLWRESPQSSVADPVIGDPENALTGQISWRSNTAAMEVPGEFAGLRFWRNTDVANLSPADEVTLPYGTIGYEWDPEQEQYANWYPPGRVLLSTTTIQSFAGSEQHHMSLYRAPSGALVFGAGTVQWSWGLDRVHDHGSFMGDPGNTESRTMQQATVNLLADMGAQPATIQSDLVAATASTDSVPPSVAIDSSVASVTGPGTRTVSGTATDEGGVVGAVEVSTDGGSTWRRATGLEEWSYTFSAPAGAPAIRVRASDDSANLSGVVGLGTPVTACPTGLACSSIFAQSVSGEQNADASAVELGVKFRSDVAGQVVGIRFYKTSGNSGAHTGTLWSATGQPLATVTFAAESATGWQEAAFSAPVTIEPGATYVASYHTTTGRYATGSSFANAGVDHPPLHALQEGVDGSNGVYMYGPGGIFPANSWNSANYLVDVLFSSAVPEDAAPPTVTATGPQADSSGANVAADVTAIFSEAMDPASVSSTTFQLHDPAGSVVGAVVSYDALNRRATLDPDTDLAAGTRYVASIRGGEEGVSDAAGNRLAADHVWGFLTGGENTTAPVVIGTSPSADSTGAARDANATVTFSEAMDPASINASTIELRDDAGNLIPASVGYDVAATSAVVDPSGPLAFATRYTVTVKGGAGGVSDASGVPLQSNFTAAFSTAGPDTAPPVVSAIWPTRDAADFGVEANLSAIFSEPMAPDSINGNTVRLRDSAGRTVNAVVTYDAGTRSAVIDPVASLSNSAEYTVTLRGGVGGVTDAAGNPMVDEYSWTFATIARAGTRANPNIGPGGPLLIVKGTSPYGAYLPEMIRAEGLNLFTVRTTSSFSAAALAPYDTLVLGETTLTPDQVTSLTDWVNAGGNLIAMRPSGSLANLLGLAPTGGTGLSEGYLKVDTSTEPGSGIVSSTMQIHGTADLYHPSDAGTHVVARLYSTATTATEFPAVTLRSVGTAGGTASAFTFDLARSIVSTRQGNPAFVGQERDGISPIRSDDLFYTDYIDRSKVAVPQADEQQRLLANLVTETTRDEFPVPRFWYFPRGEVAAVVMTADEHNGGAVPARIANELMRSPAGCFVANWGCVRSTSYQFINYPQISDAQAKTYEQQGFELALHPNSECGDPDRAEFAAMLSEQLAALALHYPSITSPKTSRNHCVFWIDYTTVAEEEEKAGINLDTNYYYWPPSWAATRPGMFTGSAMAQRFLSLDGRLIDVYQAATQMTDESGQEYPSTAVALLDGAIEKGYYGAYVANLHTDRTGGEHDAVIAAAQARSIPVITAEQLLEWTDGRNASSFKNIARNGGELTFTLTPGSGSAGLQAMLPTEGATGTLRSVSRGGTEVSFQTKVVKGVDYAVFAAVDGNYTARYSVDSTAPTISSGTAVATGGTTADVSWTTDEPASPRVEFGTSPTALTSSSQAATLATSHRVQLTGLAPNTTYYYRVVATDAYGNTAEWPETGEPAARFSTPSAAATDTTVSQFGAGSLGTGTYLADSAGGEVQLAPLFGTEFAGSGVPAGWSTGGWTGGTTTFSGGTASVDGSWLRTDVRVASGRAVEFAGTFSGAPYQNAGFGVTLASGGESWAMFGTNETTGVLQARTRNAGGAVIDVALGSQYTGSEHVFRIEWDSSVRFYVDGVLVHTAATVSGTMRALASEYTNGGGDLELKWLRVTPHASNGSFLSRIHDAGVTADWGALSYSAQVPAGSTLALDVRTGDTANPDATWTAFTRVATGEDVPGSGRYLQYRARFTTGDGYVTPVLAAVNLPYTPRPPAPDTTAPTISDLTSQVIGQSTARITWSTDEQATTRVEYGTSPDVLDSAAEVMTLTTAHSIDLLDLAPQSQYFFRVVSADAAGNTATSTVAQFTTPTPDTTAPLITGQTPAPGATEVAVDTDVTVTFNEPMSTPTFTPASVVLRAAGAGTDVAATIAVFGAVVTLDPDANLLPATAYSVTVAGSVADASGNPLGSAATWSFTTASAVATVLDDSTFSQFTAGATDPSTYVANSAGGEVTLAPLIGAEFEGSGVPAGWARGSWTGGTTAFPGGNASVDGSWLRTTASGGSGRALEFSATFTGAAFQNAGFAEALTGANESWAMFGTNETTGVLQARTRNTGGAVVDVALGSQYVGSEHVFRIEWDSGVRFYIDGALVHTAASVGGSMRPLASDYSTGGGGVTLRWMRLTTSLPTITTDFDGAGLPSGWRSSLWAGGSGGTAVSGGVVAVNGALLRTADLSGPGSSLEFVATFGAASFQHVGLGTDLSGSSPWAIFSTMGSTDTLYARTNDAGRFADTPLGTGLVGTAHTYRIDWLEDRLVFSIDGTVRHTANLSLSGRMGVVVSDYTAGGAAVTVDRVQSTSAPRTGVFTSRVLDAGKTAEWQTLDVAAQGPGGTSVVIEVRTGDTVTPDGSWTAFTLVNAGADIPGGSRYIQYRATLTGTTSVSPTLERVGVTGLVAP
ncbi:N,N-dimethylformamidase beta subunit family domain-containing protein [Agromyces laixinhei]|uniref:N,N-dimethylformamidase beta subunit family domain-containing protein n=1 Tax=Agromyces laixinhei TaxID=2585717 RepID=UPI0011174461|nr:N,N-dimethylformamidase beta subunit family domain-containing protein [Agromyces laixinhei]